MLSFWFLQVSLKSDDTKIMKKANRKKNVYLIFFIATVAKHYNGRAWRCNVKLWLGFCGPYAVLQWPSYRKSFAITPCVCPFCFGYLLPLKPFVHGSAAVSHVCGGRRTYGVTVVSNAADGCRTITFWA